MGFLILLLATDSIKKQNKFYFVILMSVLTLIFVYINPSIFLKQTNRGFLNELGFNNASLIQGTGGGNYIKSVYKEYLVT